METLTTILFALTYLGLALGRIPGLRTDRSGIALVGAALMLAFGIISLPEATRSVDYRTILLLFGMMIVVIHLELAGFFHLATGWLARRFTGPRALLAMVIVLSGTLSAFLVNDVICVALTPLVLRLCKKLGRHPLPFLLGLATASNIGSVATITGNPQNIIIGSVSGIPYLRFFARLGPVAALGLVVDFLVIYFVCRKTLYASVAPRPEAAENGDGRARTHRLLLIKSLLVTLATVAGFFAGLPIALVALCAAGVLLLGRVSPSKVYTRVDWPLLVLFCGLFVVVHAFDINVVSHWGIANWHALVQSPVMGVTTLSVVLSNLVSNVPAVLLFKPLMTYIPDREKAWLALAMSSTLAGNLTLLGSVANLIVVESAKREGIAVGFVDYLKVGVPITLITTLIGMIWLAAS